MLTTLLTGEGANVARTVKSIFPPEKGLSFPSRKIELKVFHRNFLSLRHVPQSMDDVSLGLVIPTGVGVGQTIMIDARDMVEDAKILNTFKTVVNIYNINCFGGPGGGSPG